MKVVNGSLSKTEHVNKGVIDMNNKGFMMAEVVVVSSIILVALVGLYASYNKIFSIYNQRVDYYDVPTLYELGDYRNNNYLGSASHLSKLEDSSGKKIYFVNASKISELSSRVSNQTFKDYIEFLKGSLNVDTTNILVMEKCISRDNCKYAYLEVYN